MGQNDFVESTIPLKAIKSAVEEQHTHANKELLDSLTTGGSTTQYLSANGTYESVPETFYTDAFLLKYNQTKGNVTAAKDEAGELYLTSTPTFADATGDEVIGSIELESGSAKQVNVSIAKINVKTGEVSENGIKYFTCGNGLALSFTNGILNVSLNTSEAPLSNMMTKQVSAANGSIGVFNTAGQIVEGPAQSYFATAAALTTHASNADIHVTKALQDAWNAKQAALSGTQLAAVNSGITSSKVATYDSYAAGKLNAGGHEATKNVVTDADGNITTEDKFDPSTKISKVSNSQSNDIPTLTADGSLQDSNVKLGDFTPGTLIKDYVDNSVSSAVSGSSYQGLFTYFGSMDEVTSLTDAKVGDTAIVYLGAVDNFTGIQKSTYGESGWDTFVGVNPPPANGMWFEVDKLLNNIPVTSGRIIVRMDGIAGHNPQLDIRPSSSAPLDNTTITLDSLGQIGFKFRSLNGTQVLNTVTSENIAYDSQADSVTLKNKIDQMSESFEPKITKNTAFNKNFDTSSQSGTSTMVIGDKDTRLTNARPASDVSAWAKAATKPTYTATEVGALPANGTAAAATKLETARALSVNLASGNPVDFDGTDDVVVGVTGVLPLSKGGTGVSLSITDTTFKLMATGYDGGAHLGFVDVDLSEVSSSSFKIPSSFAVYAGLYNKQKKIPYGTTTPSGTNASGDYWFQNTSGSLFTVRKYNGSTWDNIYPNIDPTWKAQVDAVIANAGDPYVCVLGTTRALGGISSYSWSGSSGAYYYDITFGTHGKGKRTANASTWYFPRVYTLDYAADSISGRQAVTYDSPEINVSNGTIRVLSNVNTPLIVVIY